MESIWTHFYDVECRIRFIDVKGIKTRCVEAGSGEPLIMLHGVGGHLEAYCRNIREHAKHFHVYAIDMIGHGFTDKPLDRLYEIPVYTKHLLDFLDTEGIQRAHISGESLGGWVAAWFAAEYPERVNKICLNTAGGLTADPEVMHRLKTLTIAAVQKPTRESVRKRLEFLMHDPAKVTDELVEIRYSIYSQPEFVQAIQFIMCLQDMDIRMRNMLTEEQLKSIQAPACIIWTTHDPTAPPEIGRKFASLIPQSEFHIMENCGHWPQYESAEQFNQIHISFFKNAL